MHKISKFGLVVALLAILLTGGAATAAVTTIDVDSTADLTQGKTIATITGSIECDAAATVNILVYVIQTGGRLLNIGIFSGSTACVDPGNGQPISGNYSIDVPAIQNLHYKAGPATVIIKANDGTGDYEMGFKTRLHP